MAQSVSQSASTRVTDASSGRDDDDVASDCVSLVGPSLGGEIAASPLPPPNPHPSFWVKCCLGNLRGKKAGECGGG